MVHEERKNVSILNSFLESLTGVKLRILMLDYDGTLAPFRVERERAFPYSGVREILNKILRAKHTKIIIVSGRWTKDLIPLLKLEQMPEIINWRD